MRCVCVLCVCVYMYVCVFVCLFVCVRVLRVYDNSCACSLCRFGGVLSSEAGSYARG